MELIAAWMSPPGESVMSPETELDDDEELVLLDDDDELDDELEDDELDEDDELLDEALANAERISVCLKVTVPEIVARSTMRSFTVPAG